MLDRLEFVVTFSSSLSQNDQGYPNPNRSPDSGGRETPQRGLAMFKATSNNGVVDGTPIDLTRWQGRTHVLGCRATGGEREPRARTRQRLEASSSMRIADGYGDEASVIDDAKPVRSAIISKRIKTAMIRGRPGLSAMYRSKRQSRAKCAACVACVASVDHCILSSIRY